MQNASAISAAVIALRAWLDEDPSRGQLAVAEGDVDNATLWRLSSGKPRTRSSQALLKLCKRAGIAIEIAKPPVRIGKSAIKEAVAESWDGSLEHAQLISSAVRSLKDFRVVGRTMATPRKRSKRDSR